MPLVEAITIEIGAAIAKSIFKLWVKDSSLGENISSSLIDLIKAKTSDMFAQRKGERQFADIGDKIGETLLPLFEVEGASLNEGDRAAIAQEVAETFKRSRLSSELLLKHNLEPTQLFQYMLASNPTASHYFSEAAAALYQRIIKESCTYIVDIASQLPAFNEHTFAEVLKREDQIIARTKEILDELRKMRAQLDPSIEFERFEIEYRQAVTRNLDVLQLVGVDVSVTNRRHRLSMAYITLSVAQKLRPPDLINIEPEDSSIEIWQDIVSQEIVSVDQALASSRCLLVRGPAGSGKTTLLQWVAIKVASRNFEEPLSHWNKCLPFYIRLRNCVQSGLPRPEAFPGFVAPAIADTMPKGWAHDALKSGRGILLVDGVDEIPESQRNDVYAWLKDLLETYPKTFIIVTSRPHAVEEGWIELAMFRIAELLPLQLFEIYDFIDHWHNALQEELQIDQEKFELGPLAEHLKLEVKRNRVIRALAMNPLLCAMLCALNRERRQYLPVNRVELYQACCSLLLKRRDEERHVDLSDYPTLHYKQKQLLLEDLAYRMLRENLSEAEVSMVDTSFANKLEHMLTISSHITGTDVRRLFVERAGIIREIVPGRIDFVHRTFQEFFAAQATLDGLNTELLIENALNDQWREVIILAAGLASKPVCEKLIDGLITRGDKQKRREHRYRFYIIAISCMETAIELGSELKAKVENRLRRLVPPKNFDEARTLAVAGELAVKYLAKKRKLSATTAAASIRTLALIGSDAALNMLEGYACDTREMVVNELLEAWDAFDRETYAKRVLSLTFQNKSSLRLDHLSSLDGIQNFVDLTSLNLSHCSQLIDLTPLGNLTSLTSLDLSYCTQLTDLSPLNSLGSLNSLSIPCCSQLRNLSLRNLTNLISLDLYHCTHLKKLGLMTLTSLSKLNLAECFELSDLSLIDLTGLIWLSLSHCSQLSDLSPLKNLTSLTFLDLSSCLQLSDLNPLTDLTNLASLNLSGCSQLSGLNPLKNLINLTSLNLSHCSQLSDLSPLNSLTSLETLYLSHCSQLSDLSPLNSLTSLETLYLSHCSQLHELNLKDLIGLVTLNLSGCPQLRELSLKDLTRLSRLNLSGCRQLYDLTALTNLNSLQELIVSKDVDNLVIPPSIKENVHIRYV